MRNFCRSRPGPEGLYRFASTFLGAALRSRILIAYLLIFALLWFIYKLTDMKQKHGAIFGLFLVLVFSARFIIEIVKVKQAVYADSWTLSAGQLLSIPFLLVGIMLLLMPYLRKGKA